MFMIICSSELLNIFKIFGITIYTRISENGLWLKIPPLATPSAPQGPDKWGLIPLDKYILGIHLFYVRGGMVLTFVWRKRGRC